MDDKAWYQSKTVWLNVISVLMGVLPLVQEHIDTGNALTLNAALNIILRFVSHKKLKAK